MSEPVIAVIIAAAGSSSRYEAAGGVRHKLDEDLGGKPVIQRTVEAFSNHDLVREIIVAGPADEEAFAAFKTRHGDRLNLLNARLIPGGREHRWQSVAAALAVVSPACTHIAVHDAARPCVSAEFLSRVFDMAAAHPAVVPAIPADDTLKRFEQTDRPAYANEDPVAAILGASPRSKEKLRVVRETIDRRNVVRVQTPQVFEAELLRKAYRQSDLTSTDDASLVERLGVEVAVAEGDTRNIKITVPADLALARAIMGVRGPEEKPAARRF